MQRNTNKTNTLEKNLALFNSSKTRLKYLSVPTLHHRSTHYVHCVSTGYNIPEELLLVGILCVVTKSRLAFYLGKPPQKSSGFGSTMDLDDSLQND